MQDAASTNPSIFVRLRDHASDTRELAWEEFDSKYRPMIQAFTRRLGMSAQDSDDVVQDVLLGFFSRSPTFVYDPGKGRFRYYLRSCVRHAIVKRLERRVASLDSLPQLADDLALDHVWNDVWESESLRQAIEAVRVEIGPGKTFLAFERFVMFEEPADVVAAKVGLHINSVYRAKDQVLQLLHQKLRALRLDLD